jgi:hypothetical protein
MTAPSFNYFYRVELTVVRLGDQIQSGTQTVRTKVSKTFNFVSKSLRDAVTPSDRETMVPILESVGEVTLNAGEFLPSTSFSSISIINSRGSFGADRRFSDVLERYTPINQDVTFYVGESDNFTDMPSSWVQIASGQVQSWSTALGGQEPTIAFQIAPYKISERIMNLEVSRDIAGMENAPDSSLGVALPIVFNMINQNVDVDIRNYQQCTPTRISADGSETAKYAVCSLMYQHTTSAVVNDIYIKKTWETDAEEWGVFGLGVATPSYLTTTGATTAPNTYLASAYRIPEITTTTSDRYTGFLVQGVSLSAVGGSSNPSRVSTASIDAYILRVDKDTYTVIDEIARGRAQLANYDALNNVSGTNFTINISFNQPVFLELNSERSYDFYIAYESTGWAAGDMNFRLHPTASRLMVKVSGATDGDWKIISPAPSNIIAHRLRVVSGTIQDHEPTYSKDGFTYSSITLSQPTADVGQVNSALDSINIIAIVLGFRKYNANPALAESIYSFSDALYWLSFEWNGEQWVDVNNVDITTLNQSHYIPLFKPSFNAGLTSGTSTFYDATGPGTNGFLAYKDSGYITIIPHIDNTGPSDLYVLGASDGFSKEIRLNDAPLTALTLRQNVPVTLVYNGTYYNIATDTFGINTHRARYLHGIIEGKISYSQLISEIARGCAAKVGILSSKKLFMYPWGVTVRPAFNIPQADIIPLSWEMRDPSTIINRTQITFKRIYAIQENVNSQDGYNYSIDFSNNAYAPAQEITAESKALYGVQNIVENTFNTFGLSMTKLGVGNPGYLTGVITNSQPLDGTTVDFSVDFLAEYYMTRFALPAVYCSFVVPWHRYKNIKMFDVITFAHSEFPAYYGTDPNARPGVVVSGSNTTAIPNAGYGQELTRGQTYRGLVEGISYVMAMEHAPAIRLTVLVLLNREYDPT